MRTPNRTEPDRGGAAAATPDRGVSDRSAPAGGSWGDAAAVAAAVAAYGLSYGVLAVAAGLSPTWATLSSVLVLAGGSQFAFVAVLAAGGNPFAGAVGGLLLNVRYLAFGLSIARVLPRGPLPHRMLDAYRVVDESVALALAAGPEAPATEVARRFRRVGWAVVIAWIGATAIGAFGGQFLGDPRTLGLDAAFPAGFVALLAPWLRHPAGRRTAALGALLAVATTPLLPPGIPLLIAGLGVLAGWRADDGRPAEPAPSTGDTDPGITTTGDTDTASDAGTDERPPRSTP